MLLLAGCGSEPPQREAGNEVAVPANVAEPAPAALPTVEQPLSRREIILAATESASDLVTGTDDTERQQRLNGRSFSLRIRLCEGAPSRDRLNYDPEERVLRVAVRPDIAADDPVAAAVGAGKFEAVEGFWVPYPWLLRAACPTMAAPQAAEQGMVPPLTEAPAVERPTVGLAEFFLPDADRSIQRSGRPFSVTRRLDEGSQAKPVDLVLHGRLTRLPNAKVINCITTAPMLAPQCLISVSFDKVQLEQAETGELLGEWSGA
jgi:hypothetical protein